ncbi:hypothetical protein CFC21_073026 [Triticum aestivum]|uniref:Uncharacterized protein n=3 Tax=Triticum TaxID=4564 RepID=A0A9R0XFA1_TRITD|nr:hypothetical protein CFC21_073026 [Triticum aestivum]VAI35414.1 unnamed protein product [Triticum turgidum subsp. durum]
MLNLRMAKGDNGDNASSAKGGSGKSALKDVMELLTDILTELEMKLEDLEQEMTTPSSFTSEVLIASKASGGQSAGNFKSRAASSPTKSYRSSNCKY